ncbi:hypothetical protein [Mucilaginibacter ginsenosidivorax]|uniref:Uncharacterized protein n=1 Tax=Mucilaginibacter ginsenosidivorax TaxID=862126 RepID=A0A5B8W7B5_9SPHI|nr:hypothetical protein [Mucilaginibacter ginsenosidivorax]QEC78782.1 hypothetical protein FSB76_23560 [Mucilaginibacter ginsenosidivorax]
MEIVSLFGSTIRETIDAFKIVDEVISLKDYIKLGERYNRKIVLRDEAVTFVEPKDGAISVDGSKDDQTTRLNNPPKRKSVRTEIANDIFENRLKAIMRIVVTLILLGISVYLLVVNTTESKTLPCSIISAVTGYWLK